MAFSILLYQATQFILSIPLKYLIGTITELQIGPMLYLIGPPPPLVDRVDHPLRHGVLIKITEFEDAPS